MGAGAQRHVNNFTVLRLLAAALVIVGHAYDLQSKSDLAKQWTGYSFGAIALGAFFSISGYLLFISITRRPDVVRYARARALRILPGLWVMLIVTWALGAAWSFLPALEYFRDPVGWKYIGLNAAILPNFFYLPRVFEGNPTGPVVNGSLWTLRYEILCYAGLGILSAVCVLATRGRRRGILFLAALCWGGWLLTERFIIGVPAAGLLFWVHRLNELGFCFLLGMGYAEFKPTIRSWHLIALVAVAILVNGTFLSWPMICATTAALVFWFAFVDAPLTRRMQRIPDISYGIYIYAYPIQQAIIFSLGLMDPLLHAALAIVICVVPASLSWFLIEKPALQFKDGVARFGISKKKIPQSQLP